MESSAAASFLHHMYMYTTWGRRVTVRTVIYFKPHLLKLAWYKNSVGGKNFCSAFKLFGYWYALKNSLFEYFWYAEKRLKCPVRL